MTNQSTELEKEAFKSNNVVQRGLENYYTGNKVKVNGDFSSLPVQTGHRYNISEKVDLAENISLAPLIINTDRNGPSLVNIAGNQLRIPRGEVGTLRLNPQEVKVYEKSADMTSIEVPRRGETISGPILEPDTIEVTPVIRILNNGEVSIYE